MGNAAFARRANKDGSTDLICASCFRTVASSHGPDGLWVIGRLHVCDPYRLTEIQTILLRWSLAKGTQCHDRFSCTERSALVQAP